MDYLTGGKMKTLKTAERIIDRLFTNGQGDKAKRLMLILEDNSDGGGWGKFAVKNIIEDAITEDRHQIKDLLHTLAMCALQSESYHNLPDLKDATDKAIQWIEGGSE